MREEGDLAEPRPALAGRRGMTQRFPRMGLELGVGGSQEMLTLSLMLFSEVEKDFRLSHLLF